MSSPDSDLEALAVEKVLASGGAILWGAALASVARERGLYLENIPAPPQSVLDAEAAHRAAKDAAKAPAARPRKRSRPLAVVEDPAPAPDLEPVSAAPFRHSDPTGPGGGAAVQLVEIAESEFSFGVGDDGEPFSYREDQPHLVAPFRGSKRGLRSRLARRYFEDTGKAAPQQALADALAILEGEAADCDPEPVHLRIAEADGAVYLDAGDAAGTVYQISHSRVRVADFVPVKFERSALTAPWPRLDLAAANPSRVMGIFDHLNIDPRDHRPVLAALVSALVAEDVPHPILALRAESGAAKTTTTRRLVALVDPSPVPVRAAPRNEDQWLTTASGSWAIGIDNLSKISVWLSDALCRAATGDGDVKRKLYTDGDLVVVRFRRFLIINGITFGALRGDLADRIVPADLRVIPEESRRDDASLQAAWDAAYPGLVADLLAFSALVHQALPAVHLDRMPRMADFARVLAATDQVCDALGIPGASALDRFRQRSDDMARESLYDDPFIEAVVQLAEAGELAASVTSRELLDLAEGRLSPNEMFGSRPKGWPTTSRQVSDRLNRHLPAMRRSGFSITKKREKGNVTTWCLEPPTCREGTESSPLSPQTGIFAGQP